MLRSFELAAGCFIRGCQLLVVGYPQKEIAVTHFEPVAYRFDPPANLPLTVKHVDSEEKQSTLGEVLDTLREQEIRKADPGFGGALKITTATETFRVGGPSFNVDVLKTFLDLEKDKISVYSSRWYCYDRDHVTDDLHESYSFFVVHGDAIVREHVSFNEYSNNGFDAKVFRPAYDTAERPIWRNEPEWAAASDQYWYRKFYTETTTGRLMLLRPDEPTLYHYEKPQDVKPIQNQREVFNAVTLVKIYQLLWVLVPLLVGLAFPVTHDLMVWVAVLLGIRVLWTEWVTRKITLQ